MTTSDPALPLGWGPVPLPVAGEQPLGEGPGRLPVAECGTVVGPEAGPQKMGWTECVLVPVQQGWSGVAVHAVRKFNVS